MEREIIFNREHPVTDIEWLETDGKGGYASSTVSLCNTRKYHGLYAVPVTGLEGRHLFLSGIEPVIDGENSVYEFSNSQYPGKIHPEGFKYLKSFSDYPFPCWKYSADSCEFAMELFMTPDYGLIIKMRVNSKKSRENRLKFNFLFSLRNTHHLSAENSTADIRMNSLKNSSYSFSCYKSLPPVYISFSSGTDYISTPYWIKDTEYLEEYARGFDFREDRIMPGTFSADLKNGEEIYIWVSLASPETVGRPDFDSIYNEEKKRRQQLRKKYSTEKNHLLAVLKEKSHHFFIENSAGGESIVAGYPWFGEWGRDTMIALPGLTFFCRQKEKGLEILRSYSRLIKNGLLPNTLSGTQGFESYNSVDASLLYIFAVQQLFNNVRGGKKAAAEFLPAVKEIIDAFLNRSSELAYADKSGFITAGSEYTQLTWMDAMVDNVPVTPRSGSPVDINALWYNGLMFFIELSEYMKADISEIYASEAEKVREAFKDKYWIEEGAGLSDKYGYPSDWCYDSVKTGDPSDTVKGNSDDFSNADSPAASESAVKDSVPVYGYTADTVNSSGKDFSVRPNMLWAVSLPYSPLGAEERKSIVRICRDKLLTTSGLRTLSPDDPCFQGEYSGGGSERDSKYHQGTVWPWLFGIYTEALLRVSDNRKQEAAGMERILDNFLDHHLLSGGFGFISEVFDGCSPDKGKGTYAQAWSCGEVIRTYSLIERVKRGLSI